MPKRTALPAKAQRRPGRPPGSTSDATRQRIVRAACECFGQKGYGVTTNRDIAERAGITAAAIYQYFDSKCALYVAAVRDAHQQILPIFREAVKGAPSARVALRNLAQVHATTARLAPSLAPFLSALPVEMQRHQEISEVMMQSPNEIYALLVETVERGVASGEISESMGPAVVSMYVASMMGLSLYAAVLGTEGLLAAVDAFSRLLDGTLLSAPRPTRSSQPRATAPPGNAKSKIKVDPKVVSRPRPHPRQA